MKKYLIWLLLLPFYLQSSPLDPESLVLFEGIPQIHNMVDPVSGGFSYSSKDLVVKGAEPIEIIRNYVTGDNCQGDSGGWEMFSYCKMTVTLTDSGLFILVSQPNGPCLKYKHGDSATKPGRFVPDIGYPFFKNCNGLELSARTNLKNNYIMLWFNDRAEFHTANGSVLFYRWHKTKKLNGTYYLYLQKEIKPNGSLVLYEYDSSEKLIRIKTTNPTGSKEYASINFTDYQNDYSFKVKTSNDLSAKYNSFRFGSYFCSLESSKIIKEVIDYENGYTESDKKQSQKVDGKKKHYKINKSRAPFVNAIDREDGFHIKLDYYRPGNNFLANDGTWFIKKAKDPHAERVKNFFAPVNKAGEFIPIYCFRYHLADTESGRFKGDCLAHVVDFLNGNEFFYAFDRDQKVRSIRWHYDNNDLTMQYSWQDTNLVSHTAGDGQSSIAYEYCYDDRGNVLTEKFSGNLSGIAQKEQYTRRFQYSNDGFNLPLRKEEDNGLVILYSYKQGTDLITSKLSCSQEKVLVRKFFEYNDDNILIKEITDDGSSLDPNDLASVNIRKIKIIHPKEDFPAINLPEVIEEFYWDSQKQQKILLTKTVFHYSDSSDIIQEDIYDAENVLRYSINNKYNDAGLLIEKSDPLGCKSFFEYNEGHNLVSLKKENEQYSEHFLYDHLGRLIKKEQTNDSELRIFTYSFDGKNNKIAETDFRKNTTRYEYNGQGHLKKTILSPVENENKTLISYSTQCICDGFGRETQNIDSANNVIIKSYNAYNKPTKVSYPDGTQENFVYNSDGTLKESLDQEGNKTCYTYDVLGRELTKNFYSKYGELLSSESKKYNGFELIAHTDAEGHTAYYFYDGAGRKIAEEFCSERKEYFYDTLGRLQKVKTCNGDNSLFNITIHDLLGRVIEERQEDEQGKIFAKTLYTFDKYGNKVSKTTFIEGKESVTFYFYDAFHRLIKEVDAQNHETITIYNDHFVNQYGQEVLQKTQIDPIGVSTIETYNSYNLLASSEKQNSTGKKLSHEDCYYDSRTNLIKQISEIISQGSSRIVETLYSYDNMNRLQSLTEAANTADNRTTYYYYTPKG